MPRRKRNLGAGLKPLQKPAPPVETLSTSKQAVVDATELQEADYSALEERVLAAIHTPRRGGIRQRNIPIQPCPSCGVRGPCDCSGDIMNAITVRRRGRVVNVLPEQVILGEDIVTGVARYVAWREEQRRRRGTDAEWPTQGYEPEPETPAIVDPIAPVLERIVSGGQDIITCPLFGYGSARCYRDYCQETNRCERHDERNDMVVHTED